MGTLWNTYAFFCLYADVDKYNPAEYDLKKCKLSLMDKWILSKLNTLVDTVDKQLAVYNITDSARALQDFADILSNWYVRRGRDRYWGSEMTEDKAAAYTVLWHVLVTFAKLTAPYTPFMAEQMYRNLVTNFYPDAPASVHLCSFPVADMGYVDKALEDSMDLAEKITVLGRSARNTGNLKIRQPLSEIYVVSEKPLALNDEMKKIILSELNVKEFKEAADITGIMLTKLDGTAKGGIVFAIKNEYDIPVKLVGTGEGAEDISLFDAKEFVDGILGGEEEK
jgi:isoleucyl-tRNA synthetase